MPRGLYHPTEEERSRYLARETAMRVRFLDGSAPPHVYLERMHELGNYQLPFSAERIGSLENTAKDGGTWTIPEGLVVYEKAAIRLFGPNHAGTSLFDIPRDLQDCRPSTVLRPHPKGVIFLDTQLGEISLITPASTMTYKYPVHLWALEMMLCEGTANGILVGLNGKISCLVNGEQRDLGTIQGDRDWHFACRAHPLGALVADKGRIAIWDESGVRHTVFLGRSKYRVYRHPLGCVIELENEGVYLLATLKGEELLLWNEGCDYINTYTHDPDRFIGSASVRFLIQPLGIIVNHAGILQRCDAGSTPKALTRLGKDWSKPQVDPLGRLVVLSGRNIVRCHSKPAPEILDDSGMTRVFYAHADGMFALRGNEIWFHSSHGPKTAS